MALVDWLVIAAGIAAIAGLGWFLFKPRLAGEVAPGLLAA